MLQQLSEHLYRFEDTCNVYLVRDGTAGLLIDAGGGDVADAIDEAGVGSIDWVLHTHFHRDQCWGTPRLRERFGCRVAVPEYERYLFASAREHWQTRRVFDSYSRRDVAFAPGEDIPVDAELQDYERFEWRGLSFHVLPAKGHTLGSVSLLADVDGSKVAFTGDLLKAGGHVHELHALEYGHGIVSGVLFTLESLHALRRQDPDLVLPSHGPVVDAVSRDVDLLDGRLRELARVGPIAGAANVLPANVPGPPGPDPESMPEPELVRLSEHLLWSGPYACSNFYALLSDTGEALLIDYGHPHYNYLHVDRDQLPFESQRFVVHRLEQLRERFGVHTIEVVCATHAHDDHVCGIPYLQRHHATECWALDAVANVIERPADWAYLPATFPKPIEVHRRLADGERASWRGFELTFWLAPGHAEYHSLISAEIDGRTVVFSGDNYWPNVAAADGGTAPELAHHARLSNGFRLAMPQKSVGALRAISPELFCPGHGDPIAFDDAKIDEVERSTQRLREAYRGLVGDPPDAAIDVFWARLRPYFATAARGTTVDYTVAVRNNLERTATFTTRLLLPAEWGTSAATRELTLPAGGVGESEMRVTVPDGVRAGRALVTAEVLVDGRSRGPVAEALVTVVEQEDVPQTARQTLGVRAGWSDAASKPPSAAAPTATQNAAG